MVVRAIKCQQEHGSPETGPSRQPNMGKDVWSRQCLGLSRNGQAGDCSLVSDSNLVVTSTNLKMVAFAASAIDVTSTPVKTVSAPEPTSALASTSCPAEEDRND